MFTFFLRNIALNLKKKPMYLLLDVMGNIVRQKVLVKIYITQQTKHCQQV